MSSKSSKNKNKRNGKTNDDEKDLNNQQDGTIPSVLFRYPGRMATLHRSIRINDNLSIIELLKKVALNQNSTPPDAKKLFNIYYMEDIYPFLNKHGQATSKTKKEISKLWDLQSNKFHSIYIRRADLLYKKWLKLCGRGGVAPSSRSTTTDNSSSSRVSGSTSPTATASSSNKSGGQTVMFTYYSIHYSVKTNRHIFINHKNLSDLLLKVDISVASKAPTSKELFEIYYYDEILPFLKKSGQQSIRGKKDLYKLWQIQNKTFKDVYEQRAKLLMDEWVKVRENQKNNKKNKYKNKSKKYKNGSSGGYVKQTAAEKWRNKIESITAAVNAAAKDGNQSNGNAVVLDTSYLRLISTLLNFLLFIESTTKDDCFLLLIDDQQHKYNEYYKLNRYLNINTRKKSRKVVYLHFRISISNFNVDSLRLRTGKSFIKLCFVVTNDPEEELSLFHLNFNDLISGLEDRIDHTNIESNLDDDGILAVNVPFLS